MHPFVLPDEVDTHYPDGDDFGADNAVDAELEADVIAAWEAFHPGEPLPPKGTVADFNTPSPEFDAALGIQP